MRALYDMKHMKKFLLLYQSEGIPGGMSVSAMMASVSPEQMKAGMAAWQAWYEKSGSAVVDMGAPLDKSTLVKTGSSEPHKTRITGYTVLQAGSLEEAIGLVQGHPTFTPRDRPLRFSSLFRCPACESAIFFFAKHRILVDDTRYQSCPPCQRR